MINILSYVGMNVQSEVCLWTLVGLVRTIFDATLFKVNANLKQVWQMSMPDELSMPVQHVLRTIISGIMLVQCFTVYVYLASYIVLLYPVFLEERPALVLPWLLLAAIRKLLCELTSLAVGLGICVLIGPARPPCIKFLITKMATIMPAFYTWILVYSYYQTLKIASTFRSFSVIPPPSGRDYGLELAIRRRLTKSLFGEEQLREKLVAGLYAARTNSSKPLNANTDAMVSTTKRYSSDARIHDDECDTAQRLSTTSNKYTAYDDWLGNETMIPRGSDRILEQFVVMLLRISDYLKRDGTDSLSPQMYNTDINSLWSPRENIEGVDITDTPSLVATSKGPTASYLREYPQIFMKNLSSEVAQPNVSVEKVINKASSLSSQSISSNATSYNLEENRMSIEKALDILKLSQQKVLEHSPKLSAVAPEDIYLPSIEEINHNSSFIDKISDKVKPCTSKKSREDLNEETSNNISFNLENKNPEKVSSQILSMKSTRASSQENKTMEIDDNGIIGSNSSCAVNQETTNDIVNNMSQSSDKKINSNQFKQK